MSRSFFHLFLSLLVLNQQIQLTSGFNCSKSTACQKDLEQFHVDGIKSAILTQLRMSGPPDASKMPSKQLREEYRRIAAEIEELEELHAEKETETMLIPARDPSAGEDASQLVATFDVTDNLALKEVVEARLIFQINLPDQKTVQDIQIQVYEKNLDGSLGEQVVSQVVSVSGNQRIKVDLPTDAVTRWYTTSPISGIFVQAMVNGHNVAIHPQQTQDDYQTMILQLMLAKSKDRQRRSVPVCTKESDQGACCLHDFWIDFDTVGWEWIIAPRRFNAYICRGNCQLNQYHYNLDPGHTKVVQAAAHLSRRQLENVGMCCHPSDYSHLKLIYVNRDAKVSVANVKGMIARRCTCA